MKMISMITIALLPLLSLAQLTTNITPLTNIPAISPECQKASLSVSSSCLPQMQDLSKFTMMTCGTIDQCNPDQIKAICQKTNQVLKCYEPVMRVCQSYTSSDLEVLQKQCSSAVATGKVNSGFTFGMELSILGLLLSLVL